MRSLSIYWRRAALNFFIAFHVVAILGWAIPESSLLRAALVQKISSYILWSGIWQGWDMFATNPRATNVYEEAEITFQDGRQVIWKFPRMEQLGLVERYFKERYRKWANDNIRLDANSRLWPDAARYIARLHANSANPPRSVKLVRYWADIPPPTVPEDFAVWRHFVFFVYSVQPGDLA